MACVAKLNGKPLVLIILFFLFIPFQLVFGDGEAKKGDVIAKKYEINIAQESYLVINGHTNVNNFSCVYDGNFYRDTLTVKAVSQGDYMHLENAVLKLKTKYFDCRNNMMNSDFRDLLQADKYPNIIIHVMEINKNLQEVQKLLVSNTNKKGVILSVKIDLAGKEKSYELPVEIKQVKDERFYIGHLDLDIRDFGLSPPKKMLGLITVNERVSIDFMVRISLVD